MSSILHITESHGGGVASAIFSYVRSTPSLNHHLLAATRDDTFSEETQDAAFCSRHSLPRAPLAAMRAIRSAVEETNCTVAHAHSSWAGVLVRLALLRRRGIRVVYSPHCFAFERKDLNAVLRAWIWLIERLLSFKTDAIAACSTREAELARSLGTASVTYVPNVPDAPTGGSGDATGAEPESEEVVAVGRLSAQKDPQFFADVAEALRRHRSSRIAWVGGGDDRYRPDLETAGIEVTGWLPRQAALSRLGRSSVYVHTALWEGFPQTILEASARGIPIVARRIPALDGCPEEWMAHEAPALAEVVTTLLDGGSEAIARNVESWRRALARNTQEEQRTSLLHAYNVKARRTQAPKDGGVR